MPVEPAGLPMQQRPSPKARVTKTVPEVTLTFNGFSFDVAPMTSDERAALIEALTGLAS